MVSLRNYKPAEWKTAMERKKLKHSIAGCWTAVILNPIWLIVDYFTVPDDIWMVASIDIPVSLFILLIILTHKKLRLSSETIAFLVISSLSVAASYVCAQLDVVEYQLMMMAHTSVFIGAGMLVLVQIKYSIITVLFNLLMSIIFFYLYSPLSTVEYILNGGLLVLLVSVFMIISVQIRYRLTSRAVSSKLILKSKQKELIEAKLVAEKSKNLQSQFLSNMSHEIRTPMNGIVGISRILKKSKLNEEQEGYLDAIILSSENLMVIINDILDFSKIEAGKVEIENTTFDLDKLLAVGQKILQISAEQKGLFLKIEMDDDVPSKLKGDPVRLNQILTNLINNSIKFTEEGGVAVKIFVVESEDDKVKLQFDIIDTGIGISDSKKDSIFESFIQASSSTTRTHGGTGLGLTITKQLVELQNGEIWVNSELGKGSTFSFSISFEVAENKEKKIRKLTGFEAPSSEFILEKIKGTNILLAEDHPINQMLATKVLEDWNFNVDVAENGLICLEKMKTGDYDVILMDISMPHMDGITTTKEIRSGKHTSHSNIPIIAMTASALNGDSQKCIIAGMNDYISKPFNPKILLEKIYNQVSNESKRA